MNINYYELINCSKSSPFTKKGINFPPKKDTKNKKKIAETT